MDYARKIEIILEWAEEHPTFDTDFVKSVEIYYENHGYLSDAQEQAVDNIIRDFRIPMPGY